LAQRLAFQDASGMSAERVEICRKVNRGGYERGRNIQGIAIPGPTFTMDSASSWQRVEATDLGTRLSATSFIIALRR